MKRTLITGITSQDGAYLAELLLEKGYRVFGLYRRTSNPNFWRLRWLGIMDKVELIQGDITDSASLLDAVKISQPDEIYNLAAQSFVEASFRQPLATAAATGLGLLSLLEIVRLYRPETKVFQACSSEQFGSNPSSILDENSMMAPSSPYACSKTFAFHIARVYRDAYGIFAANGILFNHESPLRGLEFVTRKVTNGAAMIKHGQADLLRLGNLEAERDWGSSSEYVKSMWLMLQQEKPDDFVIATGEKHSVREMVELAFGTLGLDWEKYVEANSPSLLRPLDVNSLCGDYSKAERILGWKPRARFKEIITEMAIIDADRWSRALTGEVFPWDVR